MAVENDQSGVPEVSIEDRIANFMVGEAPGTTTEEPQAPEPESDELSLDDLEASEGERPPEPVEFEITHNGVIQRLTAEQTKDYASKGFDYTAKTQQLAQERQQVLAVAQAVQQAQQIQPHLLNAVAEVKAIDTQLAQYQGWDRLRDANEDPVGYTQRKAQFDMLLEKRGYALQQAQQIHQKSQQLGTQISQQALASELSRAIDAEPKWRDPQVFQKDAAGITRFLGEAGYSQQEIESLTDSRALLIAHKAAKYDALVKAKGSSLQKIQGVPAVARPGTTRTKAENVRESHAALDKQIRNSTNAREREALITRKFMSKLR